MNEFTYTEAKEILEKVGRFTIESYGHYGLTVISVGSSEYAIGNDDEADEAWDQYLENYIDECIMPELPDHAYSGYLTFDREGWKWLAYQDGRGHSLSSYDGEEIELPCGLYLYRIN